MSSKKKRKQSAKNTAPVKTDPVAANTDKAADKSADDADIPVQSLSEMLAFAHEAEKKFEESEAAGSSDDAAEKGADINKVQQDSERSEPKAPLAKEEKKQEAPAGPPISAEERQRQAQAEDALDRDLLAARSKKLKEEEYLKRQRELELKKEAERIERAELARKRQQNAAEAAKKLEAAREKQEAPLKPAANAGNKPQQKAAVSADAARRAVRRYFNRTLFSMAAGRAVAVAVIVLGIAYGGAHIYVKSVDDELYSELETQLSGRSRLVSDSSIEYTVPGISPLSFKEKQDLGLSEWLADSDKDGLSDYYEINVSLTDPLNADSDGDGVGDGAELRAELDPLLASTDGVTPDAEIITDTVIQERQVTARISGIPKTSYATLTRLDNNSIQGAPGIIGYAYEFYSEKAFDSCELVFSYTDDQLSEENADAQSLSVYRFDPDSLAFQSISSTQRTDSRTVSASVSENGIYALCDSSVLSQEGETNIFFLIDNSGSMYPEELCANSEENDVEFKRLDFAVNLIDMLGTGANYGAGEFSGSYAGITPISSDSEGVKQSISDIRNKNQIFSGTEIAGAITSAVSEFGTVSVSDRNYIILLTDGMPSVYNEARENAAIEAAAGSNITIFTIGLGKYIDSEYLNDIANRTNGQFFQASNADALENIYEKIKNFMSYNQVTIEEDDGSRKGYIVADSGFNVQRDGIGYSNFRADFAPNGADVGIAGLIRAYYTGELQLSAEGFSTTQGKEIKGYDISAIEGFADGRTDLRNVEITALEPYNEYTSMRNKWDFGGSKGGVLHYTNDTRKFVDAAGLKVFTTGYEFTPPEESGFMGFLRTITFRQIRAFSSYECVLLDSSVCTGAEAAVMDMLRWYCNLPFAEDKCTVYDFGYEGDEAFAALVDELTTGSPAVITYGGSAMNAVRLVRDAENPDKFVLDAYDSNSPDRSTRISIVRTPIYSESTLIYQYTASRGSVEEPLRIIVTD